MLGTYLQDCLNRRLILFTGKGGVGKSAVAWATALLLQKSGKRVTLISWHPYDRAAHGRTYELPGIDSLQLTALGCFREYALQILKFDKIYDTLFENRVLKTFVQAAPGLSETVIAGKIWQLFNSKEDGIFIVDLPSSGHSFSFFQSPLGIKKIFALGFVHKETSKIAEMFQNSRTRLDFVAIPEEMSLVETQEFYDKLKGLHPFSFGYLHVNQCTPAFQFPDEGLLSSLPPDISRTLMQVSRQREREVSALQTCTALPLHRTTIHKFGTERAGTTVEKISEALSKQ